ncbi:hypothetical protein L208DRAFT_365322 [Tricholoma matsutake]|nr:hypothetical protein L208DRAFT_365322 [Tricholoma matsutake 945]
MVHFSTPIVVAAVALNFMPSMAAPMHLEDERPTRNMKLETRGTVASKVVQKAADTAKNIAHSAATKAAGDAINSHTDQGHSVTSEQSDALKKMTGPHNPAIVSAVLKGHSAAGGKKKRDVEELFRRFLDELEVRGPIGSKAVQKAADTAKNIAHSAGTKAAENAINSHLDQGHSVTSEQSDALKKMTGPHNPAIVDAAVKGHSAAGGKKKRDVDELFRRYLDELEVRGPTGSKVVQKAADAAKNIAHSAATKAAGDAINSHSDQGHSITSEQSDALKKMTGPHNPAIVSAVVKGHSAAGGKKKRDVEELLRRFLDELEVRNLDELDA